MIAGVQLMVWIFAMSAGVDQPGMIEQFIVGPGRIGGAELVTNDVVFQGEQGVQHTQADPPVAVDSGYIDAGSRIERQQAIRADCQFAAFTRPHLRQRCCIAPVQLGAIPPVCGSIEIRRGKSSEPGVRVGRCVCAECAWGVLATGRHR